MCDASQGFEAQDLNILSLAQRNKKGIVLVVNKWDLVQKNSNTHLEFERRIREKVAPNNDIPILFTSVLKKQRILDVLDAAMNVYGNRSRRVPTSELNESLKQIIDDNPPPIVKDKIVRIKYVTQLPTPTPAFALFCNMPQYIRDDYKRFLENKIRKMWDFKGAPVELYFRKK